VINLLDTLNKLGKLYIEKENLNDFEVLVDNKNVGAVVLVELVEESNGEICYNKSYQEDYDLKNKVKYLYKKGSSNGVDISPSCLITELKKTFKNKFIKWFDKNKSINDFFEKLNELMAKEKDNIFADLNSVVETIENKNSNILLSLVIKKDNEINYLYDLDEFKNVFIESCLDKFQGPKKIKGNGTCYLCNQEKEVFGLVSNSIGFTFSTPEKIGNVPGNDIKNQWKLLPICSECAIDLNAGKNFVEEYLNFSEFGLKYYAIPNLLFDSEKGFDKLYDNIKLFKTDDSLDSSDVTHIENKLGKIIKRIDDIAEFKFLFYQSSNNAFDILAYVESVIPSWLNVLYSTQFKIFEYDFFKEKNLKLILGNNHEGNFIESLNKNDVNYPCANNNWYKKFLRDFINPFSRKIYIDTVVKVISNRKLDYNFLISRFIDKIRSNWRNEEMYALKIHALKSLMLLLLFNDVNLIKGEKIMDSNFDEFSIDLILNSPSKKATFLLGALTRKLMNIQYKELNSTPFYNNLWGLSLDQKKIKKLYPKLINKLREYDVGYIKIEEDISKNLALAENDWKLNRDETSYYFVLGFTLYNFDKSEEKEDDLNE
jgi:CRISPR-associated protein Csh1